MLSGRILGKSAVYLDLLLTIDSPGEIVTVAIDLMGHSGPNEYMKLRIYGTRPSSPFFEDGVTFNPNVGTSGVGYGHRWKRLTGGTNAEAGSMAAFFTTQNTWSSWVSSTSQDIQHRRGGAFGTGTSGAIYEIEFATGSDPYDAYQTYIVSVSITVT